MVHHFNAQAYSIMLLLEQSNKTSRPQNKRDVRMALKAAGTNIGGELFVVDLYLYKYMVILTNECK